MRKIIWLLLVSLGINNSSFAQSAARQSFSLNEGWLFAKSQASAKSEKVNLPHTWNAYDVADDVPGYYRGEGRYRRSLFAKTEWKSKKVYLHFEGANQEVKVLLNGREVGEHLGGYTGFLVPLNHLLYGAENQLEIIVNNRFNQDIPPLTADFTFFGGIYRNVSLLLLNDVHFEDLQFGSNGLFITPLYVSTQAASLQVKGQVYNASNQARKVQLTSTLIGPDGEKLAVKSVEAKLNPQQNNTLQLPLFQVDKPLLWSPENPARYQVKTEVKDMPSGKVVDQLDTYTAFRYFKFDAQEGFFLNGKPYKLIGASRHQDYAGLGNAVPEKLQVKDIELLKAMGGNFLRVAHYPQIQAVLDACDRIGLLAAVEIPIVNEITESEAFTQNCLQMQQEMILQNYNHPSIIIWAYMNEVLLKMRHQQDPERKQVYIDNIAKLARQLEVLTRKTDSTRYTLMSNHGDINGYVKAGLVAIPQLVGWNLYQGWYGGKFEDFGPALDRIHAQIPDKPLLVTEFGADVDPRIHAFPGIKFDKSAEYGIRYHQSYIEAIKRRPFVAAAAVWNLADFSSETREETMPGVNNKGLLTLDRKAKNTYYLYQAHLLTRPFLKIGDATWQKRGAIASADANSVSQSIVVLSNTDSVTMKVNGIELGKQQVQGQLTYWTPDFTKGLNHIDVFSTVNGKVISDRATIDFQVLPQQFNHVKEPIKLNLLLGSERQYYDQASKSLWLPSQPYKSGSWGSVGGTAFKMKTNARQSYASDKNIENSSNDPIYQSQLSGIKSYSMDLPDGNYAITMHFAELEINGGAKQLPYNLDSPTAVKSEAPAQRIFNLRLNGKPVLTNFNLARDYGVARAVQKEFNISISKGEGLSLEFEAIAGEPVLNALQIRSLNNATKTP